MLHGWNNFFIMAGTAAATLVGLLFVAVTVGTVLSTSQIVHGTWGFLTPTLLHLGSVLFQTLVVLAPWPSAWPIGIILGQNGLMGLSLSNSRSRHATQSRFGFALARLASVVGCPSARLVGFTLSTIWNNA
jgi:hypothetical protein